MKRRVVCLVLLLFAAPATLFAATGKTGPSIGGVLDPLGTAQAKIDEARHLALTQRPLDMQRWWQLLDGAQKISPTFNRKIAAEYRRCAILLAGYDYPNATEAMIGEAAKLDHRLAFDDTVRTLCNLVGWPPEITRLVAERQARDKAKGEPKEAQVVVVPYKPIPEGFVRPVSSPQLGSRVGNIGYQDWPKIISKTAPVDPRSSSTGQTVTLYANVDLEGRVTEIKDVSGPDDLKNSAETAVRQWKFRPLQLFGHPLESTVQIEIPFGLEQEDRPEAVPAAGGERLPKFGEYVPVKELPEAIKRIAPSTPPNASTTGTVIVQALVGSDGTVKDTKVVKSIPELDEAAVSAVRQWQFKPAMANGKAVAVWVAVPVKFPSD